MYFNKNNCWFSSSVNVLLLRPSWPWSYGSEISAYHHESCELEPRSWRMYSIEHYVIKFVSDLRQVGGFLPHGEVYSIQQYVIKFVSDLRQIHGFLDQGEVNNIMW